MANKVQKPCKICGKMFTPCADCENDKTMFRRKRVACSPKCAKVYFVRIEASRQPKVEIIKSQSEEITNAEKADALSESAMENVKPKGNRKKYIKNEESEQID